LFQAVEQMRIIAVIRVAGHAAVLHPTGVGFIQQRQGNFRFKKVEGSGTAPSGPNRQNQR
jgi:hypothetical protein